jgi:hypothetical protein
VGFSLGGSYGSTSSNSSSTGSQAPTYSGNQSSLQSALAALFQTLAPSMTTGGISPNVAAVQTQNADTINKSYSAMGDRMNRFLAGRGFGQSGETGKAQLQTELGRQGALAGNNSNAGQMQLGLGSSLLSDALMYAFANPGQFSTATGSGSSSGFSVGGGVGGKF